MPASKASGRTLPARPTMTFPSLPCFCRLDYSKNTEPQFQLDTLRITRRQRRQQPPAHTHTHTHTSALNQHRSLPWQRVRMNATHSGMLCALSRSACLLRHTEKARAKNEFLLKFHLRSRTVLCAFCPFLQFVAAASPCGLHHNASNVNAIRCTKQHHDHVVCCW